jgi:uncharacterized protein YbaP (TraB family)
MTASLHFPWRPGQDPLPRLPGTGALLLALLLALTLVMLPAPGTGGAAGAAPLFEVEGTGNRIVLLGSVHFLRPTDGDLPAPVLEALEDAEVVYLELDMDDLDPVATAGMLADLARDPEGRDLPTLLGDRAWAEAREAAANIPLDLTLVSPFEPWYAALMISQLRLAQVGLDPSHGVEARVAAAAQADGKEVRGLETMAEQLGALDGLSAAAQRAFLLKTLADAAEIGTQVDGMVAAWKAADMAALEENLLAELKDQDEVYQRVVVERNQRFASTIARLAGDSRDYLVVMGALHLVGPDGVPRLLRARGLRVTGPDSPPP